MQMCIRDRDTAYDDYHDQQKHETGAYHAKLLSHNGKDEVRVFTGDGGGLALRTFAQTRSGELAGCQRDLGPVSYTHLPAP